MSDPIDPSAPRNEVEPPELPKTGALITLAVGVVVIGALYVGRDVLIPITLSVLLSFLLAPIVSLLRRAFFGRRVPAVLATVILALALSLGIGAVIGTQVASLGPELPYYEAILEGKVSAVEHAAGGELSAVEKRIQVALERPSAPGPPAAGLARPQGTAQNPVTVRVEPPPPSPFDLARQFLGPVVAPIGTGALVLVITVFVLLQQEDLRDRVIRLFGASDLHRTTLALNDAARRLSRYFLAQATINACFGLVISVGLFLIGLPSPAIWGLIAGLMRFVPYVGVPLAAILPVTLAAAVDPGWGTALWTVALFFCVEAAVGQAIEPLAYGRSTGLSPVSVMIAAVFWTWIWGPIGLLLSTPLTLCLVVLGRHVERLEFLDVLLGDRPALSPTETLYQRMLADDPDEAATQAEQLLRERPLAAYYDEIVLRSLKMAADDAARGVLIRERQAQMRSAICGLVADLEDHEDVGPEKRPEVPAGPAAEPSLAERVSVAVPAPARLPPGWNAAQPVLCVGGRTALDDAAAAMVAQLLRKQGLGARCEKNSAVSRERIAWLDLAGVGAICVSYMAATGSPAHLRYLLRRLRVRAPRAVIVLGLWQGSEPPPPERDLQGIIGPDAIAGTLREAVALVLEAAAGEPLKNLPGAQPGAGAPAPAAAGFA